MNNDKIGFVRSCRRVNVEGSIHREYVPEELQATGNAGDFFRDGDKSLWAVCMCKARMKPKAKRKEAGDVKYKRMTPVHSTSHESSFWGKCSEAATDKSGEW